MCNDKHNNEETKSRLWIWIIIAIIGVIALWGLSWILIDKYIDSSTDQGTFGDKFGAVFRNPKQPKLFRNNHL